MWYGSEGYLFSPKIMCSLFEKINETNVTFRLLTIRGVQALGLTCSAGYAVIG
jgi:hypothetical protein